MKKQLLSINLKERNLGAHLLLVAVNLIYGFNFSIAKAIMPKYIQAFGFIVLRVGFALTLFTILYIAFYKTKFRREDFIRIILCGFFGIAANQMLFFKGISYTSSIHSALIMITTPLITFLLSRVILNQALSWRRLFGILIGAIGAGILIISSAENKSEGDILGDFLVLLNAVSYAIYLILAKPLMLKYPPLSVIFICFLSGFPWVLAGGGLEFLAIRWEEIPKIYYLNIFFVLFFATFIVYFFNIIAMKKVSASVVSSYIYIQPAVAILVSIVVQNKPFQFITALASVLIALGLYLANSQKN